MNFDNEHFPHRVWQLIIPFLSLKDACILGSTCSRLARYQKKNLASYVLTLFHRYLKPVIDELLEFEMFEYAEVERSTALLTQSKNTEWFNTLKRLTLIWQTHHANQGSQEQSYTFTEVFAMHRPKVPLTRETIGAHAVNEFQRMISHRLEQDQKGVDKFFDMHTQYNQVMKRFKDKGREILEQHQKLSENEKELFVKLRWMISQGQLQQEKVQLQQFQPPQINQLQQQQSQQPEILQLLDQLTELVDAFTTSLNLYLKEQVSQVHPNAFEFILDYTLFWMSFSSSIREAEQSMFPLEQLVNDLFQQLKPEMPQYPKFSFWRLFVKHWLNNIYFDEQIRIAIETCFTRVVKYRRNQLLSLQFQDRQPLKDEKIVPVLDYISNELYDNFVKRRNCNQSQIIMDVETHHPFFCCNPNEADRLLQYMFQTIQDISLNDVNVHWIGHSECVYEHPMESLRLIFLQQTSAFYEQQKKIFSHDIAALIKYFQWDLTYVREITDETTTFEVFKLQREHLFTEVNSLIGQKIVLPYIQEHENLIIKFYQNSAETPKNEKTSMNSSANEQLNTNEEEPNTIQIFNFFMENPQADLQEMILKEKLRKEPDFLEDVLKTAVQDNYDHIQMILFTQDIPCEMTQIQNRQLRRSYSNIKKIAQNYEVPDDLIQSLKLKCNLSFLEEFQEFCVEYERQNLKRVNRDTEIQNINDEREIPRELPPSCQDFYYLTKDVTLDLLIKESIHEEEMGASDTDSVPVLSTSSSKIINQGEQIEEYNTDEEDEFPQPPSLFKD